MHDILEIGTSCTNWYILYVEQRMSNLANVAMPARQKAQCGHWEGRQARLKMSSLEMRPTQAVG